MVVIGVVLHDAFTIIWVEWGGGRKRESEISGGKR
jgi:hypothetical protein